jgi:fructose-bisphosphate aldolase class I
MICATPSHSLPRPHPLSPAQVLAQVFAALAEADVLLEAIILKANMVLPGAIAPAAQPQEVAAATLQVLQQTVPPAVPSMMFLSGGQSKEDATQHLALMKQLTGPSKCFLLRG